MHHRLTSETVKQKGRLTIIVLAALATGVFVTWFTAWNTSRKMRAHLLENARIAVQTVGISRVTALSGTAADLHSPDYLRLKNELVRIRHAVRDCRFVYLMGRRPDGVVFFYADSEPVGSRDESPAGQTYDEATTLLHDVFTLNRENTEGPARDRWGTWLSAFVPLTSPQSSGQPVVLGMDVDARDWMMAIAASSAIPLALTALLFIALGSAFLGTRQPVRLCADRPALRRLMLPLAAAVFLLVTGFSAAMLWHEKRHLNEVIAADIASVPEDFTRVTCLQAETLHVALGFIADDPEMHATLKARDRAGLLSRYGAMFAELLQERGITQFTFYDPNWVVLTRLHRPARHGDVVERFTLREAQRTGGIISGVEVGRSGTLSQRLVKPIFDTDHLIGFIELGCEIKEVIEGLGNRHGMDIAVVVHKDLLDRQDWEMNVADQGHTTGWDRFPENVLVYNSLARFPAALDSYMNEKCLAQGDTNLELTFDGATRRVAFLPLIDISNREVGHFVILCDTSAPREAFARLLCIVGAGCLLLFSLLLGFFYVVLKNTDQGIEARALALRESEAKWRSITENSPDCITVMSPKLEILFISRTFPDLGVEPRPGMSTLDVMPAGSRRQGAAFFEQVLRTKKPATYVSEHPLPTGGTGYIESTVGPVVCDGQVTALVACSRDISNRQRAEDALQQESLFRRAIIANAAEGLCVCHQSPEHPSWVFTVWNDRMTEISGYTMDQINEIGWERMAHTDPESETRGAELIAKVCQGEEVRGLVWEIIRRDGQHSIVEISFSPLVANNSRLHVLIMVQDITDRKEAEAVLNEHVREIERFNRLATERELRVIELKKRINALSLAAGQAAPFDLRQNDEASECTTVVAPTGNLPAPVQSRLADYSLDGLLDRELMQNLFNSYCDAVGVASAIIDLEGKVFVEAHWQRICTRFHRVNPQTCARCIESDTILAGQLEQGEQFSLYRCRNGLTDAASPIVIEGRHAGNVFVGQFLLKPADEACFRSQAAEFGFDETAYLEALSHVPVVTEDKLSAILTYLTSCARVVAQLGLNRVRDETYHAEILHRAEDLDRTNKALRQQREAALSLAEDADEARAATEKARRSLRDSEEWHRQIANCLPDLTWTTDLSGRFTYVNRAVARIKGWTVEEYVGLSFWDVLPPEQAAKDAAMIEEELRKASAPGYARDAIRSFESEELRKDGSTFLAEVSAAFIWSDDGKPAGIVGITRDITDRKRAEEALQRSEQQLRTVIEAARDAIVMMGPDGGVTLWSPGAEAIFGWKEQEVLGKPVHQLLAPARFHDAFAKGLGAFHASGQGPAVGRTVELDAVHQDGHELPIELSLSAIQQSGRWCAVGIVRDISERKQFEKLAQNQLHLLQALMDAVPNPIYFKDTRLHYLGCNQAFERLFGASKDQIVGKTVHDIAPKLLADAYHAADLELLARPHLQTYEGTLTSADGVDHDVLFRKAIFRDAEGQVGGIVGVLFDATDLARIQEALLVKDSALNSASCGIVMTDLEGRVTYANPSCLKMWGFGHEQEVLNQHFISFLQPPTEAAAAFQSALETGAWYGELPARRKDGSEFVVQVSGSIVRDKQDKPICMMASLVDVTEGRRINGILDRKQKNLEAIFDAAPLGMLLVNERRRVARANDTIRQISGKGYPEILNQHPCQALRCVHSETGQLSCDGHPACDMCPLQKLVEAAFEFGLPVHGAEARLAFRRDGKQVRPWFSINLEPVNIDGDKHILIALHDITDRKQAEEQLLETMEMKSQFISTVSHEVRTPLTAMKEALTIVADGMAGTVSKDQTHFLDIARRNIDRLALLIDDVLDFQKLSAGKMKFHMQPNRIDKTLEEACATMRPHAQQKQIHVSVDLEANLPPVVYDHDRMIQVFTNLLSNAIKFTPEGGRISISARRRGEDLAISVSDTGMGIPREALPRIFTRFYRVHRPGKEIKGTGLGLAIVARIVAGHGGRIDVESEVAKGTTFTVLLPLAGTPADGGMSPQADGRRENTLTNDTQA